MKLSTFFLFTHGAATAAATTVTVAICQTNDPLKLVFIAALAVVAAVTAASRAARSIRTELRWLETVVTDCEKSATIRTGLVEFNSILQTLGRSAKRWETAAATSRQQQRELQTMLGLLGGPATRQATSGQLRDWLAELGTLLQTQQDQLTQATTDIALDAQTIAEASDTHRQAFAEAVSCCDQLLVLSDSLDQEVSTATSVGRHSGELATRLEQLRQQTHLLALNASLQVIRHSERVARSPHPTQETESTSLELQVAIDQVVSLLNPTASLPPGAAGAVSQDDCSVRDTRDSSSFADLLAILGQLLDEHSLCIHQLSKTTADQRRFVLQLRAALAQCSAAMQLQQEMVVRLHAGYQQLATHSPLIEHQIDRLRRCGTNTTPPASETPLFISDELCVCPSEPDRLFAGGRI